MSVNGTIFQIPGSETKSFHLSTVFSITDGRLATDIDEVYNILNWIFDESFMTHHLPTAMDYLQEKNPPWYQTIRTEMEEMFSDLPKDDWATTFNRIQNSEKTYEIPRLRYTQDISDFHNYMIEYSLLKKVGSAT
jgi:hypothetical protein